MPETQTAARGGLFTKDDAPVPLAGVAIDAEISTLCARVTVTQRYVNRETTPIEAVYVFPLDEGAAVCGFEAIIDGTLVVGEVKEREAAFEMYDDAMQRGHGAYLLDEERPDVFQASVGNLPPGREVLLKLTYVTELSLAGGAVRFAIPTTIAPRYAPAEDRVGVGRPDSEALNPPVAWSVPYGLDLNVRVAMTGAIARVESTSHPVSVSIAGHNATVTLSQRDTALDRDFVLSVEAADLDTPRGWIEKDDDGAETVAIAFAPAFSEASAPAEIIFLVDRSGSMEGQSIAEVRNALQLCLRSMLPGCAFNIVGFGGTFQALFNTSRAYDEKSLAEASEHVARLDADLGGTEILPALEHVLEQPRHATLPRQIVILTDGEVTNTDAVLALAAKHAAGARIFTFGIGASASQHQVKGLARAGGGVAEFIYPGERIEPKVVRQFGRLLSPALTDVRIDWHGADVTQAPATVPPVFANGRLLVYGFLKQRRADTVRAQLSANAPSGPVSFDVAIGGNAPRPGRIAGPLGARARIRELEESPAWTSMRGSRQSHRKANAVTQEIIALSTRYGVISRETSFVAVERRETPVEGEIQLRRVPVALAAGWGGLDDMRLGRLAASASSPMPRAAGPSVQQWDSATTLRFEGPFTPFDLQDRASDTLEDAADFEHAESIYGAPEPAQEEFVEDPMREQMMALIMLQRADGSWEVSSQLESIVGRDSVQRGLESVDAIPPLRGKHNVWATVVALAWLDRRAAHLQGEWEFVAAKGRQWLARVFSDPNVREKWIAEAATYL